eukprot:288556_1
MCTPCNQTLSSKLTLLSKWKGLQIKEVKLHWSHRDRIFNWFGDRFHWVEITFITNNVIKKCDIFVAPDSELDGPYTLHVIPSILSNDNKIKNNKCRFCDFIKCRTCNVCLNTYPYATYKEVKCKICCIQNELNLNVLNRIYNKKIIDVKYNDTEECLLKLELKDKKCKILLKWMYKNNKIQQLTDLPQDIIKCIDAFIGGEFYTLCVYAQCFRAEFTIVQTA